MSEPDRQRKLSAVMFTDIVGYSKMMEQDESATLSYLKFHKLLIYLEVEKHAGSVVKTVGDAFLADFPSAVNAVKCAVTIQRRLQEYNQTKSETRQVRIGIHIGDVVTADNDIFGDAVNIASRLQAIAHPGGVCISEDVHHQIKYMKEYDPIPLGPQVLKNVSHKVEAYEIFPKPKKKLLIEFDEPEKKGGSMAFVGFLLLFGLAIWGLARWYFSEYPGGTMGAPSIPTPTAVLMPATVPTPTEAPPVYTATPEPAPTPVPRPRVKAQVKKKAKARPRARVKARRVIVHQATKRPDDYVDPETVGIVPVVKEPPGTVPTLDDSVQSPPVSPSLPTPSGDLPPPPSGADWPPQP